MYVISRLFNFFIEYTSKQLLNPNIQKKSIFETERVTILGFNKYILGGICNWFFFDDCIFVIGNHVQLFR